MSYSIKKVLGILSLVGASVLSIMELLVWTICGAMPASTNPILTLWGYKGKDFINKCLPNKLADKENFNWNRQ